MVRLDYAKANQIEFGALVGCNRVTVSRWETGVYTPGRRHMQRISRLFPAAPPPPGAGADATQRLNVAPATEDEPKRGYLVRSTEGIVLAKIFDAMEEEERGKAIIACMAALRDMQQSAHPSELGASTPGRSQRSQ